MPQCIKCNKKGLFLKIEEDTHLCLACNEAFAKAGKLLTEKIMQAKSATVTTQDKSKVAQYCSDIEKYGEELMALHAEFNIDPSQELIDLIDTYKKMREMADG